MHIFELKFKVRSYECDSYGHVNNAVYLNYLEYARMSALIEKGFTFDSMKKNGYLAIVRHIEIDFKYPLFMGNEVLIKSFISSSKTTSGTFTQKVYKNQDQTLCAEAKVTWVFTNLKGKPIAIPGEIQQAFGF